MEEIFDESLALSVQLFRLLLDSCDELSCSTVARRSLVTALYFSQLLCQGFNLLILFNESLTEVSSGLRLLVVVRQEVLEPLFNELCCSDFRVATPVQGRNAMSRR